jgi:hypothetical protein
MQTKRFEGDYVALVNALIDVSIAASCVGVERALNTIQDVFGGQLS